MTSPLRPGNISDGDGHENIIRLGCQVALVTRKRSHQADFCVLCVPAVRVAARDSHPALELAHGWRPHYHQGRPRSEYRYLEVLLGEQEPIRRHRQCFFQQGQFPFKLEFRLVLVCLGLFDIDKNTECRQHDCKYSGKPENQFEANAMEKGNQPFSYSGDFLGFHSFFIVSLDHLFYNPPRAMFQRA